MTSYQANKERARKEAINWQFDFDNHNYSWGDLYEWQRHFEKLGRRYGLMREFHENAIC